jgi:hypothetical protein
MLVRSRTIDRDEKTDIHALGDISEFSGPKISRTMILENE